MVSFFTLGGEGFVRFWVSFLTSAFFCCFMFGGWGFLLLGARDFYVSECGIFLFEGYFFHARGLGILT